MQLKVYEITWGETQTATGSVAGNVVSYGITFSDQGVVGPVGPQGIAGPIGLPGDFVVNFRVVSASETLVSKAKIAANTAGGPFTLTLPANPTNGDVIDFYDYAETFDSDPLTLARNGQRIEGSEDDLICNVKGAYFSLVYSGTSRGWQVLPSFGTAGGGGGETVLVNPGDLLYRGSAGVNTRLQIGTAGQVLKVNSGATAPEWATVLDGTPNYVVVTTAQTLTSGAKIAANTKQGPFALTLPAAPQSGDLIELFDLHGTWGVNPLTVNSTSGGGQPFLFEGRYTSSLRCDVPFGAVQLVYVSALYGWKLIPLPKHSLSGVESANSVTFAVLGDGGTPPFTDESNLVGAIINKSPEFIVHVGDINQEARSSDTLAQSQQKFQDGFLTWWQTLAPTYLSKIYWAAGNHDVDSTDYGRFILDALPATKALLTQQQIDSGFYCYDFVKGPVHFFVFNSGNTASGNNLSNADENIRFADQLAVMSPRIRASSARWKVAVVHKPPYTIDALHSPGSIPVRLAFQGLGLDAVMSGHGHTGEIIRDGTSGPFYFVNGLGGASFRATLSPTLNHIWSYNSTAGFMLVNATMTEFSTQYFSDNGILLYSHSFSKSAPQLTLGQFYAPSSFAAPTTTADGKEGFVPAPLIGDGMKFLRADGTWQKAGKTSTVFDTRILSPGVTSLIIDASYDIYVIGPIASVLTFTYANFLDGDTVVLYLLPEHNDRIKHNFPSSTLFSELGGASFAGYATKITIQRIGNSYYAVSDLIALPSGSYPISSASALYSLSTSSFGSPSEAGGYSDPFFGVGVFLIP